MILDERNEFFDGVAIPTTAGTSILGDVIDTSVARDLGNGQPIYWYVAVDVAGADGTSAQFNLVSSDAAAMTSPTVHISSPVTPVAQLTAGKMLVMIALPIEGAEYKRYLGVQAVVAGTFTGGNVSSGLTLDPHGWQAYPEAVN